MSWLHEKHFNSSLVSSEMTNKTFIRQIISFFLNMALNKVSFEAQYNKLRPPKQFVS